VFKSQLSTLRITPIIIIYSFDVYHVNSVNLAPQHAMYELGNVIPRIIQRAIAFVSVTRNVW
jgi:hypothetical protein